MDDQYMAIWPRKFNNEVYVYRVRPDLVKAAQRDIDIYTTDQARTNAAWVSEEEAEAIVARRLDYVDESGRLRWYGGWQVIDYAPDDIEMYLCGWCDTLIPHGRDNTDTIMRCLSPIAIPRLLAASPPVYRELVGKITAYLLTRGGTRRWRQMMMRDADDQMIARLDLLEGFFWGDEAVVARFLAELHTRLSDRLGRLTSQRVGGHKGRQGQHQTAWRT